MDEKVKAQLILFGLNLFLMLCFFVWLAGFLAIINEVKMGVEFVKYQGFSPFICLLLVLPIFQFFYLVTYVLLGKGSQFSIFVFFFLFVIISISLEGYFQSLIDDHNYAECVDLKESMTFSTFHVYSKSGQCDDYQG